MKPKIGILGTVSTGKSTTIEEITKKSNLLYIKEDARSLYEKSLTDPNFDRESPECQLEFQRIIFKSKYSRERSLPACYNGFIADRTYIDNFMYFLYYCHKIADKKLCEEFENMNREAMKIYTHLFILELDSIPYKQDKIRTEKYGGALLLETGMYGIIHRWHLLNKVKVVPCSNLEDRVNFIMNMV